MSTRVTSPPPTLKTLAMGERAVSAISAPSLLDQALDAGRRAPKRNGQMYSFAEEREPCGDTGLAMLSRFNAKGHIGSTVADLSDCLVSRPRPWLLVIWEPLPTKAPGPHLAQPHCCYIKTVIFYHRPYIVGWPRGYRDRAGQFHRDGNGGFIEWDKIETRLTWDDVVEYQHAEFAIGGGRVVWSHRGWWMLRGARRQAT